MVHTARLANKFHLKCKRRLVFLVVVWSPVLRKLLRMPLNSRGSALLNQQRLPWTRERVVAVYVAFLNKGVHVLLLGWAQSRSFSL